MLYNNPEVFGTGKIISSKKVSNPNFIQISLHMSIPDLSNNEKSAYKNSHARFQSSAFIYIDCPFYAKIMSETLHKSSQFTLSSSLV